MLCFEIKCTVLWIFLLRRKNYCSGVLELESYDTYVAQKTNYRFSETPSAVTLRRGGCRDVLYKDPSFIGRPWRSDQQRGCQRGIERRIRRVRYRERERERGLPYNLRPRKRSRGIYSHLSRHLTMLLNDAHASFDPRSDSRTSAANPTAHEALSTTNAPRHATTVHAGDPTINPAKPWVQPSTAVPPKPGARAIWSKSRRSPLSREREDRSH